MTGTLRFLDFLLSSSSEWWCLFSLCFFSEWRWLGASSSSSIIRLYLELLGELWKCPGNWESQYWKGLPTQKGEERKKHMAPSTYCLLQDDMLWHEVEKLENSTPAYWNTRILLFWLHLILQSQLGSVLYILLIGFEVVFSVLSPWGTEKVTADEGAVTQSEENTSEGRS